MSAKTLFSSKKTVEPTPSGVANGTNDGPAPPIDKKFSALLGNRKASTGNSSSSNGSQPPQSTTPPLPDNESSTSLSTTSSAAAPVVVAPDSPVVVVQKERVVVDSAVATASSRERSNDNDYASLFALASGKSRSALEQALPKEPMARRALVASARDKQQQTLLHVAVDLEIVAFLLTECAADVAAADRKGTTPLHLAAKNADATLCNKLIDAGAPLLVQNAEASTALHYLVRSHDMPREQFTPLFQKLFAALPNPRLANKNGDTILHIAALYGNFECVQDLIALNAFDVNQRNAHKDAPLHYAVRGGDDEVVEALIAAGADVRMKGSVGTPLQIASKEDQAHLVPILEKALAAATQDDEEPARLNIVNELLSTERSYVDSLTVLIDKYGAGTKKILSDAEFNAVFQNAATILSFHRMFLSDLEARMSTWNRRSLLGDLFVRLHGFFKLYMQYINGFDKSAEALKSALKHRKFRDAHDQIKRDAAKLLDMASILIMPVQRIPRYSLLLEDLIRKTAADHADLPKLQEAASKMRETAGYLNAQKSDADSRARMLTLDKQFTNWPAAADKLLQPARMLKFESQKFNIAAADPADDANSEDVQALIGARDNWLFVFTDLIVVAAPNYRVVGHYPLSTSSVVRLAATVTSTMPAIIVAGADSPALSIWGDKAMLAKLDGILAEAIAANGIGAVVAPNLPTRMVGTFVKPDSFVYVTLPQIEAAEASDAAAKPDEGGASDAPAAGDSKADDADEGGDAGDAAAEGDGGNKTDTLKKRTRRRKKKKDGTLGRDEAVPAAALAPSVNTFKLPSFEVTSRVVPLPASARGTTLTTSGASLFRVGEHIVWFGGGLPHAVSLADGADAWAAVSEASDVEPTAAGRSYAAVVSDGTTAYVFGGRNSDGKLLNDLWRLTVVEGAPEWSRVHAGGDSNAPSARVAACATVLGQELYLFGGVGENGAVIGDLWRYHVGGAAWSESPVSSFLKPVARHSAAVTSFATFVLVHGGEVDGAKLSSTDAASFSDAWAYDTVSKRWTLIERNFAARSGHVFVQLDRAQDESADADGSLVVLGGGLAPQNVSGRSMAQVFGALMRRENVLGDEEKKKRSGKLARMSRVFQSSTGGGISSITDSTKSHKRDKHGFRSVGASNRDGSGSDFQIGAPSNFTNPVSVSRDFEWSDDAHKDFELTRCVGEGGFGSVWHARHRTGGFVVAVKVIRGFRGGAETSVALSSEIKVLKQCRHQCIVAYYGACFDTDHQILTNRGFLFLDEVLAAVKCDADGNVVDWCGLQVANYDETRGEIVYDEPMSLVVKKDELLVEMTSASGDSSVVATHNHQLFVDDSAPSRKRRTPAFAKHEAGSLLSRAQRGELRSLRMLGNAEGGVTHDASPSSGMSAIELELLGFWLGSNYGELRECEFVLERLQRLGVSSAQHLLRRDALWQLRTNEIASVLVGLRASAGEHAFTVTSAAVRDDVIRLLLHAGYSSKFTAYVERGVQYWTIVFERASDIIVERDAMREVRNSDASQRVWCFAMPRRNNGVVKVGAAADGFVVVRRATARDEVSGAVRSATRATIQGNCSPAVDTMWILTEFCQLGSLGDLMDAIGSPLDEQHVACISRDVADGLKYLHAKGIVHRDVKIDNILMNEQGIGMLTDFGLSERIVDAVSTRAGTPHHMAPEVVGKQQSSAPSDIWSFGITQIEMYDGRVPHAHLTTKEVMQTIVDSAAPTPVRAQSSHFTQFLESCLQKEPTKRKTAAELLALPFVAAESVQLTSTERRDLMTAFVQNGVTAYAKRGRNRSRSGKTTASRTSKGAVSSNQTASVRSVSSDSEQARSDLASARNELTQARETIAKQSSDIVELKAMLEKQSTELASMKADLARLQGSSNGAGSSTPAKSAGSVNSNSKAAASPVLAKTGSPGGSSSTGGSGIVKTADKPAVVAQRTVQAGTVSSRLAMFQQNATKAIDAYVKTAGDVPKIPIVSASGAKGEASAAATEGGSGTLTPRDFSEYLKENGGKQVVDEESDARSE